MAIFVLTVLTVPEVLTKVVLTVPQHSLNNTTSYVIFLKEKLSIVKLLEGVFVFLNIVFGCDTSPGRGIEFAHDDNIFDKSIFYFIQRFECYTTLIVKELLYNKIKFLLLFQKVS